MNELMEMLMQMAKLAEQQAKANGGATPKPNAWTKNLQQEAQEAAKGAKALYDAFIAAEFTVEQAFELTKNIITPVKRA